ncbi:Iron(II)-dependent oxidoreductase EgtB, partial [Tetrabaena socialis]
VAVKGETVVLGKDIAYPSFGWDCEYGSKEVHVAGFRASKFKVTNGEFLRFVKAGGYSNPKFWSTEGWGWKTFRNVKWPTFWMPDGPQGLH